MKKKIIEQIAVHEMQISESWMKIFLYWRKTGKLPMTEKGIDEMNKFLRDEQK